MSIFFLAAAWAIGTVFTTAALTAMGERNPRTFDDSFTGDDNLDLTLVLFWPIFWPCWIAHKIGRWVAK